jgi:hypothetical protein
MRAMGEIKKVCQKAVKDILLTMERFFRDGGRTSRKACRTTESAASAGP